MPDRMNILSPTGHLGFTPIERGSFELGVARRPDAIVADSGSCDTSATSAPSPWAPTSTAAPRSGSGTTWSLCCSRRAGSAFP